MIILTIYTCFNHRIRDRGVYTLNIDYNISKLLKMNRLLIKLTLSSLLAKVFFQFF